MHITRGEFVRALSLALVVISGAVLFLLGRREKNQVEQQTAQAKRLVQEDQASRAQWFVDDTDPAPGTGAIGDHAFNAVTGAVFAKILPTQWNVQGYLRGKDGVTWFEATGPPSTTTVPHAAVGDFYYDSRLGHVYQLVEPASGASGAAAAAEATPSWKIAMTLRGVHWHAGTASNPVSGAPNAFPGDFYIDQTSGQVFELDATTGQWNAAMKLQGATWHSGPTSPPKSLGLVGDMYLDTVKGTVFQKTGEPAEWHPTAQTKGNGVQFFAAPCKPTDVGTCPADVQTQLESARPTDQFVDTSNNALYELQADGTTWSPKGMVSGPGWLVGTADPTNSDANSTPSTSDFDSAALYTHALDTTAAHVWQKTTEGAGADKWAQLRTLAGRSAPWLSGDGSPNDSKDPDVVHAPLGAWYVEKTDREAYQKTSLSGAPLWTHQASMRGNPGAPGAAGLRWYSGTEPASASQGASLGARPGDYYLDRHTMVVYRYTDGGNGSLGFDRLMGTRAPFFFTGHGAPAKVPPAASPAGQPQFQTVGVVAGDVYLDRNCNALYVLEKSGTSHQGFQYTWSQKRATDTQLVVAGDRSTAQDTLYTLTSAAPWAPSGAVATSANPTYPQATQAIVTAPGVDTGTGYRVTPGTVMWELTTANPTLVVDIDDVAQTNLGCPYRVVVTTPFKDSYPSTAFDANLVLDASSQFVVDDTDAAQSILARDVAAKFVLDVDVAMPPAAQGTFYLYVHTKFSRSGLPVLLHNVQAKTPFTYRLKTESTTASLRLALAPGVSYKPHAEFPSRAYLPMVEYTPGAGSWSADPENIVLDVLPQLGLDSADFECTPSQAQTKFSGNKAELGVLQSSVVVTPKASYMNGEVVHYPPLLARGGTIRLGSRYNSAHDAYILYLLFPNNMLGGFKYKMKLKHVPAFWRKRIQNGHKLVFKINSGTNKFFCEEYSAQGEGVNVFGYLDILPRNRRAPPGTIIQPQKAGTAHSVPYTVFWAFTVEDYSSDPEDVAWRFDSKFGIYRYLPQYEFTQYAPDSLFEKSGDTLTVHCHEKPITIDYDACAAAGITKYEIIGPSNYHTRVYLVCRNPVPEDVKRFYSVHTIMFQPLLWGGVFFGGTQNDFTPAFFDLKSGGRTVSHGWISGGYVYYSGFQYFEGDVNTYEVPNISLPPDSAKWMYTNYPFN